MINLKKICLNSYFNVIRPFVFIIFILPVSLCNSSLETNSIKQNESDSSENYTISGSSIDFHEKTKGMVPQSSERFPYDLDNPVERYSLPKYLEEISGLAYYKKDKILCIQDERANIYVLDLDSKKIDSKYDFGKDGDYEGIAHIDETVYVLKNNGNIFEVKNFSKDSRKVKEFKTPLSKNNDTEGLTYDKLANTLLIACKGSSNIEQDNTYGGYKAVYKFDLENNKLDKSPKYLVDLEKLDSYKDNTAFGKFSARVAKKLKLIESETSFKPSGIAVHPIYGEIYIISNIGKLLIILDRHGKILDIQDLNGKLFRQPEGICFSPSGNLFISSEGKGGKGYILKFKFEVDE